MCDFDIIHIELFRIFAAATDYQIIVRLLEGWVVTGGYDIIYVAI